MRISKKAIASALISLFALTPLLGFAQTDYGGGNNYYGNNAGGQYQSSSSQSLFGGQNGGMFDYWNRFFYYWWWWNQNNGWPYGNPWNNGSGNGGGGTTTPATTTPSRNNKVPVIRSVSSPTVISTGQTATWKVEAYDPENGSLTYSVDWGDSVHALALAAVPSDVFVQTSTFTHSYDNPGTYTVTFKVKDDQGQVTTSTVTVRVRGNPVTPVPTPVISNLAATSTGTTTATVTWNTDIDSDSSVWIGTSSPVSTTGTTTVTQAESTTTHSVNLTGLSPDTLYYVRAASSNGTNTGSSTEVSFVTPKEDDLSPVITSFDVSSSTITAGETETLTVNAYDPQDEGLSYSVDWGDSGMMMRMLALVTDPFVQTSTFSHVYNDAGTYTVTINVKNDDGLETSTSTQITVTKAAPPPDTTGPIISAITSAGGVGTSTITWVTDEPADSKVFYGLSSTTLDITSSTTPFVFNGTLDTNHSINLSNLATSTGYSFVIQSTDGSGNVSTSSPQVFTTTAESTSTATTTAS
jgi:hypothetical protein